MCLSAYGPGIERNAEEKEACWSSLDECLENFGRSANVVVLGDLNARVGDDCVNGVDGKFGVPGRNEDGKSLTAMWLKLT